MVPSSPTVCYDALDPPVGGIFVLEISLMPPLPKTSPKMVSAPKKGIAFLTEDVFEKKFQVRERIQVRAAKEAVTTASTSRFVPVTLPAAKAS